MTYVTIHVDKVKRLSMIKTNTLTFVRIIQWLQGKEKHKLGESSSSKRREESKSLQGGLIYT